MGSIVQQLAEIQATTFHVVHGAHRPPAGRRGHVTDCTPSRILHRSVEKPHLGRQEELGRNMKNPQHLSRTFRAKAPQVRLGATLGM